LEKTAILIPMKPANNEVKHPKRNEAVVHNYPNFSSTAKKITNDMNTTNTAIYLYSAYKKAFDPRSIYEAISKTKLIL
jgi:hypothetical protein